MTVRIDGVVETSSSGGSSTVTAEQGTAAATADAWPVKVTDGTDVMAVTPAGQITVAQGAPGAVASPWTTQITDGSNVVGVTGGTGVALLVATGSEISFTTLNAQSAVGNGTAQDFAACYSNVTMVIAPSAGNLSAGVVALEGSLNGTNWVEIGTPITYSGTSVTEDITVSGIAMRHFRGVIKTEVTGGTVTAQIGVS